MDRNAIVTLGVVSALIGSTLAVGWAAVPTPREDATSASIQPVLDDGVEHAGLVTLQTQLLDHKGKTICSPALSLFVGQRGEVSIIRNEEDKPSEIFSLAVHVMEVEGPFYRVRIEAEDSTRGHEWNFASTVYLRADQTGAFRVGTKGGRSTRTLNVTLLEARNLMQAEPGEATESDQPVGEPA